MCSPAVVNVIESADKSFPTTISSPAALATMNSSLAVRRNSNTKPSSSVGKVTVLDATTKIESLHDRLIAGDHRIDKLVDEKFDGKE